MKRRVVLLGSPGSGKGTVAELIAKRFGLEHISTGDWFRREIDAGTKLGRQVQANVVRGELVPDEVVIVLLDQWLTGKVIERGYLLDGFPRTVPQAEALDRFSAKKNAGIEVVFYLDCPEEIVVERLAGRRICPTCGKVYHVRTLPPRLPGICDFCGSQLIQRTDDTDSVVRNRLEFYRKVTEPLVDYYRESDRLVSLNAALGSEAAFALAIPVLES